MKKVLILIHDLKVGGVATSLINVTKLLVENCCDVTIKSTSKEYSEEVLSRIDKCVKVEILDERRFPLFEKLPYFRNYFESGMWTRRNPPQKVYKCYVKKNEVYDVEIAFYYGRPVKAICGSSNKKSKKIMWLRSGVQNSSGYLAGFESKEKAIDSFRLFDKIISVSEDLEREFIQCTGIDRDRIVTIHNYLDKQRIDKCLHEQCELTKNRFTISYVCRFTKEKNIFALIRAVEKLNLEGLLCDCWLIGDGSMRGEIENYISSHALHMIKIIGYTNNPHKYVKASDLYVSTSTLEGYPNTLADSIYIGTPIVSTKVTGASNILRDGQYGLLTDFDDASIYEAIKKMMTDKTLYFSFLRKIKTYDFSEEQKCINDMLIETITK